MTTLQAARLFHEAGFNIMPLYGKRPVGDWGVLQHTRSNIEKVERFLTRNPSANLGVVCGELSGVTVVDVDISDGFDMVAFDTFLKTYPTPLVVQTGSGGWHLYYAYAEVKNAVKSKVMGLALDIRSQGGYVVAPPSVHPDTQKAYSFINVRSPGEEVDLEIVLSMKDNLPPLPEPLSQALRTNKRKLPEDWQKLIKSTAQGSRNHSAASIFGKLMGVIPPSEWQSVVWPLVFAWNEVFCSPPMEERELRTIYESICKKHLAGRAWSGPGEMVSVTPEITVPNENTP